MSREDAKKTIPVFPFFQMAITDLGSPLPTPIPSSSARGFIGYISVDTTGNEAEDSDVSVFLTSGRMSRMDKEAVSIELEGERGKRIRSVTEYCFVAQRRR